MKKTDLRKMLKTVEQCFTEYIKTGSLYAIQWGIVRLYELMCVIHTDSIKLRDDIPDDSLAETFGVKTTTVYQLRSLRNTIVHNGVLEPKDVQLAIRGTFSVLKIVYWSQLLAILYGMCDRVYDTKLGEAVYKQITLPNRAERKAAILLKGLPESTVESLEGDTSYAKIVNYLKGE